MANDGQLCHHCFNQGVGQPLLKTWQNEYTRNVERAVNILSYVHSFRTIELSQRQVQCLSKVTLAATRQLSSC